MEALLTPFHSGFPKSHSKPRELRCASLRSMLTGGITVNRRNESNITVICDELKVDVCEVHFGVLWITCY